MIPRGEIDSALRTHLQPHKNVPVLHNCAHFLFQDVRQQNMPDILGLTYLYLRPQELQVKTAGSTVPFLDVT